MPDSGSRQIPDTPGGAFQVYLTLLLVAITVTGTVDLILDEPESWYGLHTIFEGLFLTLCLGTAVWLGRGWLLAYRSLAVLERSRSMIVEKSGTPGVTGPRRI